MTNDLEDAMHGGTIKRTLKRLQGLYAIVWIEIVVLAIIIVMLAWTLIFTMDSLKDIANDNATIAELMEGKA